MLRCSQYTKKLSNQKCSGMIESLYLVFLTNCCVLKIILQQTVEKNSVDCNGRYMKKFRVSHVNCYLDVISFKDKILKIFVCLYSICWSAWDATWKFPVMTSPHIRTHMLVWRSKEMVIVTSWLLIVSDTSQLRKRNCLLLWALYGASEETHS